MEIADKKAVLIIASAGSFLTPFMGAAVNIALPAMGRELNLHAMALSWVAMSYLLAAAVVLVPIGKWADIIGRKKVFTYGIALYTLSSLAAGFAPTGLFLISNRVLQGMGGAMIFSTGVAIITSVFPPGERGRAIGITVFAVYFGLSLGPVVGGFLTQHLGWRSIFLVNVPLGLVVIGLLLWKVKGDWFEDRGAGFDWIGSIIYASAISTLIYGFSRLSQGNGVLWIGLALVGLVIFVVWERRCPDPVLDIRLFSANRVFAFSNLAALINYSATFAITFLLSLYLQYIQALSSQEAGLVLMAQPVMMALFSPLAGRWSDRAESRIVASIGMAITVVGLLWLSWIHTGTSLGFVVSGLMVLGFGFALFSAPNTNSVMSAVDKRHYGTASATLATMRLTGQMLSMGITMVIIGLWIGTAKIQPSNYAAFLTGQRTALLVFAGLCFVGIFASLARGRQARNR